MRNKRFFLFACGILLAHVGFAQGGNLRLQTDVEGMGDTLVVNVINAQNRKVAKSDTLIGKNGKIDMLIPLDTPSDVMIIGKVSPTTGKRQTLSLVGVPGESVLIKGTATDYTLAGSPFYEQLNKVYTDFKSPELKDREKALAYVMNHADQEAIIPYISVLPPEMLEKFIAAMPESVRNGRMKPYYESTVKMRQALLERMKRIYNLVGKEAPVFTLEDINGKPLSLTSLRGKYVVLDFWGSWCGWCIKGFPQMKKYYEQYTGKFEILSVACRDRKEKWEAAVEKNQLPWLHVFNAGNPDVSVMYDITAYPTKIIIDPQGKVAKVFVGEGEEFYTYLDQLFQ